LTRNKADREPSKYSQTQTILVLMTCENTAAMPGDVARTVEKYQEQETKKKYWDL
jgi:hypothetical protein